jgi:hypothetical protein
MIPMKPSSGNASVFIKKKQNRLPNIMQPRENWKELQAKEV